MASACVAQHKRYWGHFHMKNGAHTRFWVLIASVEKLRITKTETLKMMEVFVLWRKVYWSTAHSEAAVGGCWREVHEPYLSSSFLRVYLWEQRPQAHAGRPRHTGCTPRNTGLKCTLMLSSRLSMVHSREDSPSARDWQRTGLCSSAQALMLQDSAWRKAFATELQGLYFLYVASISNNTGCITKLKSVNAFKVFNFLE